MTSKEKLALIKETWYDVDLTDEKYSNFDEEQTFNDLEKDLEVLELLKPYIEISSDGIISCHNLILLPHCERYKDKYNKIREWLDNE